MEKLIAHCNTNIKRYLTKLSAVVSPKKKEGFAGYEIKVHSGTTKQLIVVFSGVGNVASGEVHFEWGNSLVQASEGAHIIFIKDNCRQWYTNPAGQAEVVAYLKYYIQSQGITSSLAFGLSMGGYGALVFASLMTFNYVIALSSRSCVGKKATFDTRNKTLMQGIDNKALGAITPALINPASQYIFIASSDQNNDLKHLALLKKSCPEGVFYLTRGDHNLGHEMNLQGQMQPFLKWLVGGCASQPPVGVKPVNQQLLDLGEYLAENNLEALSVSLLEEKFTSLSVAETPLFLLGTHVQRLLNKKIVPKAFPCPVQASISAHWLRHYLGLGWYQPEQGGVWSQGQWHQLNAQVVGAEESSQPLQIRLQVQLYFPDKEKTPLLIELYQNGQSIKSFNFGREQKNRVLAAPLVLDEEGCFELMIHTPFAAMPVLQQPSGDNREIAIYLKSFVIIRA